MKYLPFILKLRVLALRELHPLTPIQTSQSLKSNNVFLYKIITRLRKIE